MGVRVSLIRRLSIASQDLRMRVMALESELRKAKRREEKLAGLQFRLRDDLRACGGDLRCARLYLGFCRVLPWERLPRACARAAAICGAHMHACLPACMHACTPLKRLPVTCDAHGLHFYLATPALGSAGPEQRWCRCKQQVSACMHAP